MAARESVRLVVFGRVQGVFFRASTQARARSLGLSGWVRNRPDGSVEAFGRGERAALEPWIEFCRRGPPDARVDRIVVEFVEYEPGPEPEIGDFVVRR